MQNRKLPGILACAETAYVTSAALSKLKIVSRQDPPCCGSVPRIMEAASNVVRALKCGQLGTALRVLFPHRLYSTDIHLEAFLF